VKNNIPQIKKEKKKKKKKKKKNSLRVMVFFQILSALNKKQTEIAYLPHNMCLTR
jgi:hypothetical protein